MRHLKTALTVLGALTILLLAGNTVAYAATGKSLLLGKMNYADRATGTTRTTSGAVLNLRAKSSASPPLSTNARGKVTNLNADKLDGLDASTLRTRSQVYTATIDNAGGALINIPMGSGSYLVDYSLFIEPEADAPISVGCHIGTSNPGGVNDVWVAADATDLNTVHNEHAVSGSGLITKTANNSVHLKCSSMDGAFRTGQFPVQIVVTPTARLSMKTLPVTTSGPSVS